jgi:hypothetical protein
MHKNGEQHRQHFKTRIYLRIAPMDDHCKMVHCVYFTFEFETSLDYQIVSRAVLFLTMYIAKVPVGKSAQNKKNFHLLQLDIMQSIIMRLPTKSKHVL